MPGLAIPWALVLVLFLLSPVCGWRFTTRDGILSPHLCRPDECPDEMGFRTRKMGRLRVAGLKFGNWHWWALWVDPPQPSGFYAGHE
jgi:hypothetical protein